MKDSRILIVAHNSFSKFSNNGKTLESMFSDFKREQLMQVFFSENEHPDFEFCTNYFKITDGNVLKKLLFLAKDCGSIENFNDEELLKIDDYNVKSKKFKNSIFFKFAKSKSNYLTFFRDILWSFNTWKTKKFLDWNNTLNPNLVFYVGGNFGFSHNIARYLAKYNNVPLVVYFTDDYLINPINQNIIDVIQRNRMKLFYKKTVEQAAICFAIGDLMAKDYSTYFGKKFHPIMNSTEIEEYVLYTQKQRIVVSYFGGLHLNRDKMLTRLGKVNSNISINVYSMAEVSDKLNGQFKASGIDFKGAITGKALKKAIIESDILLHVESDDAFNKSLTKLSVSTKIPEYLMSGRLILGFGPPDAASMRILSDNEIGLVIPSTVPDKLLETELNEIASNFELRKAIGKKGYDYAVNNFDKQIISKQFKQQLESLL